MPGHRPGPESAEARLAEIDATFCSEGFYERTPGEEVSALEAERGELQTGVDANMEEWDSLERELETLERRLEEATAASGAP